MKLDRLAIFARPEHPEAGAPCCSTRLGWRADAAPHDFAMSHIGWLYLALADVTREAPGFGPSTTTNAPIFTRL